jgi:hypothetical protein
VSLPAEETGANPDFFPLGLFHQKTKQNQNRIFVLVARRETTQLNPVNNLSCPTFANRSVEVSISIFEIVPPIFGSAEGELSFNSGTVGMSFFAQ